MSPDVNTPWDSSWRSRWPLLAITIAAIAVGLYARFKGLGSWPFGVDEFYISRSIDYVLQSGLPEFPCGGYYARGLLYQYIVAGLRLAGLAPEFAGRLVTAIASLAVLPAAYLLAQRLHGRNVGLLVVTVLALSVWEIEMARFARMYAPFQAVFAWYLLYFVKYTVDGQRSALWGMVLLSIVGVLTWEGGVLMGLANLLPPFINHDRGRLRRSDAIYLSGMIFLFLAFYYAVKIDLRGFADYPADFDSIGSYQSIGNEYDGYAPWMTLGWHVGWVLLALLPAGLSLLSLRWLWSLRDRWLATSGLVLVLALALLHQFVASLSILLLVLLVRLVAWRQLLERPARWFLAALVTSTIFWLTFGVFTEAWYVETAAGGRSTVDKLIALFGELAGFPYVLDKIVKPWGKAIPLLSILLFAALSALTLRSIFRQKTQVTMTSALLVLVLALVLAVGASGAPREETRYTFFLYPIMVTLAIVAVALVCDRVSSSYRWATTATVLASLLAFGVSEDFRPLYLAQIDSRDVIFRLDLSPAVKSHLYSRSDVRALAQWLDKEVRPNDIVVSGIPHLDQYYNGIDYFFLDEQDQRYGAYACNGGTVERWNNLRLLHTTNALEPQIATGNRVFMLLYSNREERLLREAAARGWPVESLSLPIPGSGNVLILNPQ